MSTHSIIDNSKCVICLRKTQESLVQLTHKGVTTVTSSCVARGMRELEAHLNESPGPFAVHSSCRKRFTDLRKVPSTCADDGVPVKRLRYTNDVFDWKKMCFFCQ